MPGVNEIMACVEYLDAADVPTENRMCWYDGVMYSNETGEWLGVVDATE